MNKILSTLAIVAVSALLVSVSAVAQSASVSATATVLTPISAVPTAPLAFGTISKGSTTMVLATTSSAGAVVFNGDESDNITITLPASATMQTLSGGGATMAVTLNRAALRTNTIAAQNGSATLDASNGSATATLSSDASGDGVNSDGLGQLYLWIGGAVSPNMTQQQGAYSGNFTVSASYSN